MTDIVYMASHNLIELQELTDGASGSAITTATVTAVIKDSSGTNVSGETWPLTLSHVSAGTYRGTVSSAVSLTRHAKYTCYVTATTTGGVVRVFELPLVAGY